MSLFGQVRIREDHDNFFTPMRLVFAFMVLIGHAYVIERHDLLGEPSVFFEYKISFIAVNLFFIVSGFLVTKSILYRKNTIEYISSRALRIMPGLLAHVLFVMFIVGPFITNLPLKDFFTDPDFYLQPFKVLSFTETNMAMPGIYENNDEQIASAPLWTLRYEVLAYIGTALAFGIGLLKSRWMIASQFLIFAVAWPIAQITGLHDQMPATLQMILRFGLCYGLGAAIYAYRDKMSFHLAGIPVLGLITALFHGTALFDVVFALWLGYITFWMAYVSVPKLNVLKQFEDVSYGVYIYHWVVLQTVHHFMPQLNLLELMLIVIPITYVLSHLSWALIEKPSLAHKKSVSNWINRRLKKTDPLPAPAE